MSDNTTENKDNKFRRVQNKKSIKTQKVFYPYIRKKNLNNLKKILKMKEFLLKL